MQRLGKATGSKISDIMAKTKSGYAATRTNYKAQLVCERLTGQVQETFTNAAMLHGTQTEPEAADAYSFLLGVELLTSGFVDHPRIQMAGASPDRLVGVDGLVEIKCPNSATHIDTLLGAEIDRKYVLQMQFQMACTGRAWCDFVSYDNRLPASMRLFVQRVQRDDRLIADIENEVERFLAEVDAEVRALRERYELQEAA